MRTERCLLAMFAIALTFGMTQAGEAIIEDIDPVPSIIRAVRDVGGDTIILKEEELKGVAEPAIIFHRYDPFFREVKESVASGAPIVAWHWKDPFNPRPAGTCDDKADCQKAVDDACDGANHGKGKPETIWISPAGTSCSGTCDDGSGAQAIILCI